MLAAQLTAKRWWLEGEVTLHGDLVGRWVKEREAPGRRWLGHWGRWCWRKHESIFRLCYRQNSNLEGPALPPLWHWKNPLESHFPVWSVQTGISQPGLARVRVTWKFHWNVTGITALPFWPPRDIVNIKWDNERQPGGVRSQKAWVEVPSLSLYPCGKSANGTVPQFPHGELGTKIPCPRNKKAGVPEMLWLRGRVVINEAEVTISYKTRRVWLYFRCKETIGGFETGDDIIWINFLKTLLAVGWR